MAGWVGVIVTSPFAGVVLGQAVYHDPTQEWLDALTYSVVNRIRFPCPAGSPGIEKPMIVTNLDIKTETAPDWQVFGSKAVLTRVVTIEYMYEP